MDRTKALCLIPCLLLFGCTTAPHVVVGSKNFTEQVLVGEIVAQHIERTLHIGVERKLNLGGTLLAHQALITGSIDLYPEYTGTAITAVLKQQPSPDARAVFDRVRSAYQQRWGAVWLPPLGFNDTFAMVITKQLADSQQLRTLSQAAARRPWKLGVGYEFLTRPDGLAGLQHSYGLRLDGAPVSMDLGLLYSALQSGKVEMAAANSTDGLLAALPVITLEDDKRYFPPYECSIVVRSQTLSAFPQLRASLEALSGTLSNETIRKLNYAVDGQHRQARDVAAEFLNAHETH